MNEEEIKHELELLEDKIERLVAKFCRKTNKAVHAIFIEYLGDEDDSDAVYPIAYASLECPHEEEAEIELEAGPLNLAPYGSGGIH